MKHQPIDARIDYIDQTLKMVEVKEKNYKEIDFWLDVRLLAMKDQQNIE